MMRRIWIRRWLLENRITQASIAEDAGVSWALVSLYIKGDRISGKKAKKVKDALRKRGCPWEILEFGVGNQKQEVA